MNFPIQWFRPPSWISRLHSDTGGRRLQKFSARFRVEGLESRWLMAVTINEFPVPTTGSDPTDIASGPDGNLWFTEALGNKIGRINPTTHAVAEFAVPTADSQPTGITAGPDGDLWFTEFNGNKIGEINPTTHVIAEFPVPTPLAQPREITSGPDGNLWFTEETSNKIGRINPATGAIAEFSIPTAGSPLGITAGPDGNVWFAEGAGNNIGRINPTTGAITEFPIPTAASLTFGITTGPDGNLWFAEENGNKVGEINPATHVVAEFAVPTGGSSISEIATGSDGNLWFTERSTGQIGMINPATHSVVELPTPAARSFPLGIAAGPDGNIWFTELGGKIGQAVVTPSSTVPGSPVPGNGPSPVTVGGEAVGPTVTGVQRFGFHERPTTLVLTFDEPLDPLRAEDLANYQIVALCGVRHTIRVKKAVYNPVTRTVTLSPAHRLDLHRRFRLTVVGTGPSGLTDIAGNPLDGQKRGDPGSNFVTIVTGRNLVLPTAGKG
jgi:streptogramin lyase